MIPGEVVMAVIKINIPPFIGVEIPIDEINGFRTKFSEAARRLFQAKDKDFVGCYHIVAKHSGKCLDVEGASKSDCANVWQYDLHGGHNQQWILVRAEDPYYFVFAKHSGKCLDVKDYGTENAVNVWQYAFHGGNNQQWELRRTVDGFFHMIARNSGKALDVEAYGKKDGTNVFQYELHGGDNQKWKLVPVT
jgi:hypothetical protein